MTAHTSSPAAAAFLGKSSAPEATATPSYNFPSIRAWFGDLPEATNAVIEAAFREAMREVDGQQGAVNYDINGLSRRAADAERRFECALKRLTPVCRELANAGNLPADWQDTLDSRLFDRITDEVGEDATFLLQSLSAPVSIKPGDVLILDRHPAHNHPAEVKYSLDGACADATFAEAATETLEAAIKPSWHNPVPHLVRVTDNNDAGYVLADGKKVNCQVIGGVYDVLDVVESQLRGYDDVVRLKDDFVAVLKTHTAPAPSTPTI